MAPAPKSSSSKATKKSKTVHKADTGVSCKINNSKTVHKAVTGAAAKILNMAAAIKTKTGKDMKKKLVKALTGIQGDSTIRNALSELKNRDLLEVTKYSYVVTEKGMDHADLTSVDLDNTASTNLEHQQQALEPLKLGAMAKSIFEVIKDGRVYSKVDILAVLNKDANSTARNAFAELEKKDVIEYIDGKKKVQAAKDLFPFDPRPE
jgi:hypothetical protein